MTTTAFTPSLHSLRTNACSFLATSSSPIVINSSMCCGYSWLTTSPSVAPAVYYLCGGQYLSAYVSLSSSCSCKYSSFVASNRTGCLSLLNRSSYMSGCVSNCPAGTRPYPTGTSFPCVDALFPGDTFTMFESACQGICVAHPYG